MQILHFIKYTLDVDVLFYSENEMFHNFHIILDLKVHVKSFSRSLSMAIGQQIFAPLGQPPVTKTLSKTHRMPTIQNFSKFLSNCLCCPENLTLSYPFLVSQTEMSSHSRISWLNLPIACQLQIFKSTVVGKSLLYFV